MGTKDVILFNIADFEYGMGVKYVQGVETYCKIVKLAGTNEYIEGIVDIRGDVIPIYNLRKKFELDEVPVTEDTKFIIVKIDGSMVGFKVDFVTGMRSIQESDVFSIPKLVQTDDTSYLNFIIRRNGKTSIIIKPENLLNEIEKRNIEEVVKQFENY